MESTKKMIPTRGVFGSLETPILGQNILFYSPGFTPYFIDFGAGDMCIFLKSKNPFTEVS